MFKQNKIRNGLCESDHFILQIKAMKGGAYRLEKYLNDHHSIFIPYRNGDGSVNSLVELRSMYKHGTWRRFALICNETDDTVSLSDEITQQLKDINDDVRVIYVFNKHSYILTMGLQHSSYTSEERKSMMDQYIEDVIKEYNYIQTNMTYQFTLSLKEGPDTHVLEIIDFLHLDTFNQLEEDVLKHLQTVDPEVDELISYAIKNTNFNSDLN